MKKASLILFIGVIAILGTFLIVSSCKKDDKDEPETPTAPVYTNGQGDGVYASAGGMRSNDWIVANSGNSGSNNKQP